MCADSLVSVYRLGPVCGWIGQSRHLSSELGVVLATTDIESLAVKMIHSQL